MKKSRLLLTSVCLLWLLVVSGQLSAQTLNGTAPLPGAVEVAVDLTKSTIADLPFEQPFYLTGKSGAAKISLSIRDSRNRGDAIVLNNTVDVVGGYFMLPFDAKNHKNKFLEPDHDYTLVVEEKNAGGTTTSTLNWGVTTKTSFGSRFRSDFGLAYAPVPKATVGFTSVHFYLLPINDATDLRNVQGAFRNIFLRASLFGGLSVVNLSSDTKQPMKNVFGAGNIVYGIGIRSLFYGSYMPKPFNSYVGRLLLQPIRVNVGELLFKQGDANPLIAKDRIIKAAYIGISIDYSLATLLSPVTKILQ